MLLGLALYRLHRGKGENEKMVGRKEGGEKRARRTREDHSNSFEEGPLSFKVSLRSDCGSDAAPSVAARLTGS